MNDKEKPTPVFGSLREVMDASREFKPQRLNPESNRDLELPEPVEAAPDDGVDRSLEARREAKNRKELIDALSTHGVKTAVEVEEVPYESPLNYPEAMQRAKEHYYDLPIDAHSLGQKPTGGLPAESNRDIS
jgi:predicted nucleotidyltransferase